MEDGNGPSLPPPGDGNHGDEKKANDEASAATPKTPEVENDGDGDKASMFTPTLEQPTSPFRAVEETEAGQQGSTPEVENDGDEDKADSQGMGVTKEEQTNDVQQRSVFSLQTPGSGKKNEESSAKSTVGSSGKLDNGATQRPVQAEDHDTIPDQQGAHRAVIVVEETGPSPQQSLALKPPAQSSELARKGSLEIPGRQHPVVAYYLNLLERQEKKMDGLRHDLAEVRLAQAQDHHEVKDMFRKMMKGKDEDEETIRLLKSDNIGLKKCEKEQLQEKVDQLSNEIDDARASNGKLEQQLAACQQKREHVERLLEKMGRTQKRLEKRSDAEKRERDKALRRLEEERDAKRSEKEELQECVERLKEERDDALEANKRMKKEMDAVERQLEDLQEFVELFMEGNRLDQESVAEKLEHDLEASERRVQELQRKSDDDDETIKELRNFLAEALPFVPRTKSEYLDPFTGYAIVMSNAIMEDDGDTEIVLKDTKRLAKALFDYGFEVKPMRNASLLELMQGIQKCKERKEQPGLVFIYIAAHGDSTGIEMEEEKSPRHGIALELPKPTILCVMASRDHSEKDPSTFVDNLLQDGVFFVNACQQGCTCDMIRDRAFVTGLVKIFQDHDPHGRSFSTAIEDLREQYPKLDPKNRLSTPLVLPPYPARTWPDDVRRETNQALNNAFQYPEPADEHSNST